LKEAENSLLVESRSILPPPQGDSEEVAVDVGEHTTTKNFKKNFEISQENEVPSVWGTKTHTE
jgi:hypothetical protein